MDLSARYIEIPPQHTVDTGAIRILSRSCGTLLLAYILTGCGSGEPRPEPEEAPISIMATSSIKPDEDCLLSHHPLGAGKHEIELVSEQETATVRIKDSKDETIYEKRVSAPDPGEPVELPPGETLAERTITLKAGKYLVECITESQKVTTTTFSVVAARPGFEDYGPFDNS